MADVELASGSAGKRHGGTKSKKNSTRVDMTPMCDVAFLLIFFFMITTTLQRQKTMKLYLPHDVKNQEEQNKVKESQALTIIMAKDNNLYYYYGIGQDAAKDPANNVIQTTYALKGGIGDVIANKWKSVIQSSGGQDSMVVIIKPTKESTYENVVGILDDMNIYEVKKYALVPASDNDVKMVNDKRAAAGLPPLTNSDQPSGSGPAQSNATK
ncbi:MAG: biopolymer transporter ExbD [Chitinophagaceae bacterium]|jgi:biopolymer transport protein ExbD|nr:MAG: biopolymer transporter ExbD [Chitinophagaceae bacterium]